MEPIKVGFCVAYDWKLLQYSLPLIYQEASEICLSVDIERISWSGNRFSWDETGFRSLVSGIDRDGKIRVVEADFHCRHLSPMENELLQRRYMADCLGSGGWHVQLDADEFLLNFNQFVHYLRDLRTARRVNVSCPWITLYKQDASGFFYVHPRRFAEVEFIQIASRHPSYTYGRRNGYFNIHAPFPILHLSWARTEGEVWEKLCNWGHSADFKAEAAFKAWKDLDRNNYALYRNFHYLGASVWPRLGYLEGETVEAMIARAGALQLPLSSLALALQNSIWVSRAKSLARAINHRLRPT
jgi:hypothetical protein